MKNIQKSAIIAFVIALVFLCTIARAQQQSSSRFKLDIGIEAGLPTGSATQVANFAIGATARLNYMLASNVSMALTSGYYDILGNTISGQSVKYESITLVPFTAGFKVFITPGFYFVTEAGAGFETVPGGDIKLILGPSLGYTWHNFDAALKYENFSGSGVSYGIASVRLAYSFDLNFLK